MGKIGSDLWSYHAVRARLFGRAFASRLLAATAWLAAILLIAGEAQAQDRLTLLRVVRDRCVPAYQSGHPDPSCPFVSGDLPLAGGYAVLKDLNGEFQYLVIPTKPVTGIEDLQLLADGGTNYFSRAWDARRYVEAKLGRWLDPRDLSITVNSRSERSQDQLHLHVDCVDPAVRDALDLLPWPVPLIWEPRPLILKGHRYRAMFVPIAELDRTQPFRALSAAPFASPADMQNWGLAIVGARARPAGPGVWLLAGRADASTGFRGWAEELQDHSCAAARLPAPLPGD